MATDRFLIGYTDTNSGLQTNVKPWLLPNNAFSNLENCYIYRGRLRKRWGSIFMSDDQLGSRLRYQVATTNGSGAASGTVPGVIFHIGQMFSIGTDIFTVSATGTPATLLSTSSASMTYNTSTGAFVVTGAAHATEVYFYSTTPVMGLPQYYVPVTRDYTNIAFDRQFSYVWNTVTNAWDALTTGTATWTSTDYQFFWSTNYQGANPNLNYLWVTNNNTTDHIRYFNGTAWTTPTLTYTSGQTISTALLIVQFKNRLLLLNTVETVTGTPTRFFNRVRYSALGDPLSANAWRQDIPGNGNAIDAPVQEAIVTAQFIKDRLIVYFENSTFELAYTGNEVQPFVWQRINTELGAEGTFSEIPFDRNVFGVDSIGIHECNGQNVNRIDQNVPQLTFGISDENNGRQRVYGIRDYFTELVYWTYPNSIRSSDFYFPNKVLVYNYVNNAWSTFDDSITCFGYFPYQEETPGATWGNTYLTWGELLILWNAGGASFTTPKVRTVLAGNQQGYVFILRPDVTSNAAALQVTNFNSSTLVVTCINHNLSFDDYILLTTMNGITLTDENGDTVNTAIFKVSSDPFISSTPDSFTIYSPKISVSGTYTGGGTIARVSNINIQTKQYNFYTNLDRSCYVSKMDFLVDRTTFGEVTVDFRVSTSASTVLSGSLVSNTVLETTPYDLVPFEKTQDRLWHPLYYNAEGQCVQFVIYMSPDQMFKSQRLSASRVEYTALQDFQLHAINIYAMATSSRMQ